MARRSAQTRAHAATTASRSRASSEVGSPVVASATIPAAPASTASTARRSRASMSTRPSSANGVTSGTNRPVGRRSLPIAQRILVRRHYAAIVDSRPVLWHIAISHYSEKARWALDWKGVDAVRRAPQPGLHMAIALGLTRGGCKTFPVLGLDGRAIGDSTAIIEAL